MKKSSCPPLINLLARLQEEGITSQSALMRHPQLYSEFWFVLRDFCHYALLSKTSGTGKDGEIHPGNAHKLDVLEKLGLATLHDLESDCMVKIISKLDLALRQHPLEKQKNYCNTVINNLVNDYFRMYVPKDIRFVSLDGPIGGNRLSKEDALTYADILEDDTYHPEQVVLGEERLRELRKVLRFRMKKEQAEKKETLLREVASLAGYPEEVMVRLACVHLKMKPREVAGLVLEKGSENVYHAILSDAARRNGLHPDDLSALLRDRKVRANAFKEESLNKKTVSDQMSRLAYRAEHRLHP